MLNLRPALLSLVLVGLSSCVVTTSVQAAPSPATPPATCQAPLLTNPNVPVLNRVDAAHVVPIKASGDPAIYFLAFTLAMNEIDSIAPLLRQQSPTAKSVKPLPLIDAHLACATKYLQQFTDSPNATIATHAKATLTDLDKLHGSVMYVLNHASPQSSKVPPAALAQKLSQAKQQQVTVAQMSKAIPSHVMPALSLVIRCNKQGACQTILTKQQRAALVHTWGAIVEDNGIIHRDLADQVSTFIQDPQVKSVFAFNFPAGSLSASQMP